MYKDVFANGVDHTPKSFVHMLRRYAACRVSKSVGFEMRYVESLVVLAEHATGILLTFICSTIVDRNIVFAEASWTCNTNLVLAETVATRVAFESDPATDCIVVVVIMLCDTCMMSSICRIRVDKLSAFWNVSVIVSTVICWCGSMRNCKCKMRACACTACGMVLV